MILRKTIRITALMAGMLFFLTAAAQSRQKTASVHKIEALPRDVEIKLALSALPPYLRDSATVYVLNPDSGFEVARKGTNGFHTFVSRNGDDAMRGSWQLKEYRDDILYPISFDEAGAKNIMPVFFDIAKMQANGTNPDELKKIIQDRYKTKYYRAPERAGVSYMLSPILRTYTNPDADDNVVTASVPHVMYYAPNVTNEEFGGGKPAPGATYSFVILPGPHGYSIQFLGKTESEAVRKENKELLEQLCKINKEWCLPAVVEEQTSHAHHH
ncbi:hypothetical protein HHL16_23265 [Pseudoflavitalea sp. G-6-1-2]|uniref:hypothetical protein n=1 Tax=Pseudoflavitalea sp. G-6-1-2 TaxID=2728841 RepID=UPI00146D0326|nr:hypothetical protein [Pseudoflavitalea sp. G-6-1-2]NML23821.1 hypothetical protein [Pseudoflavitalea sp. G-6-1-2]